MTLQEAKELAQQGIKVTHEYFTEDEYMTIGNIIKFEDGDEIYFLDGWSKYPDEDNINDAHLNALELLSPE